MELCLLCQETFPGNVSRSSDHDRDALTHEQCYQKLKEQQSREEILITMQSLKPRWQMSKASLKRHSGKVARHYLRTLETANCHPWMSKIRKLPPELQEMIMEYYCGWLDLRPYVIKDIAQITQDGEGHQVAVIDTLVLTLRFVSLWGVQYLTGFGYKYPQNAPPVDLLVTSDLISCRDARLVAKDATLPVEPGLWYRRIHLANAPELCPIFKGFLLQDVEARPVQDMNCLWNTPNPPQISFQDCYRPPRIVNGGSLTRMCVVDIPSNLRGITVVSRAQSLAMHFHTGDRDADRQFYNRVSGIYAVYQHLSVAEGEMIDAIAVHRLRGQPDNFDTPNVAFVTSTKRQFRSGRYLRPELWPEHEFVNILPGRRPSQICVSEEALLQDDFRMGATHRPGDQQTVRSDIIWTLPQVPNHLPRGPRWVDIVNVDLGEDIVDVCISTQSGLECCIGIKVGTTGLGQWRTDARIERRSIVSCALQNVETSQGQNIVIIQSVEDEAKGLVPIRGTLQWWYTPLESKVRPY